MSVYRFCLGLAVGLFFSTSLASAILIETRTGPIGGFLRKDDGTELTIDIVTADGKETRLKYPHADIKILHQLDVKRLEELSPDNPKAYRDYAEQLASQKDDPEARYVAMRLYLIAAKLAPNEFGSSSLLSMSTLASTSAEARKCRAMAFLLDPKADVTLLKVEAVKPTQPTPAQAHALEDFTKALRLYRAGQIKLATETAQHDGVDKIFRMVPGKIDLKKFLQWCTDANCPNCRADGTVNKICPNCNGRGVVLNAFNKKERCPACKGKRRALCPDCGGTHVRGSIPEEALRDVLRCELWAIDRQGARDNAARKEAADTKSWSTILQSRQMRPVQPLSLETITSFDPRKCRYRNRKWVAESK